MICLGRYLLLVIILLLHIILRSESRDLYCGQIQIRHPFELVDDMTNYSGNPCFGLSCTNNNLTMIELPTSIPHPIRLSVQSISYDSQLIVTSDPQNCLPRLFLNKLLNSSIYPFQFHSSWVLSELYKNATFFNCSSAGPRYINTPSPSDLSGQYAAQDTLSCPIFAAASYESAISLNLLSCTKMFEMTLPVSAIELQDNTLILRWMDLEPDSDVQNFFCKHKHKPTKTPISTILAATGSVVVVLLLSAFSLIYHYWRVKGDDHARVENFLQDYRELKPTRFTYADLKRITNNFKTKLGLGANGSIFKGKLSSEILVAVKILNNTDEDGQEFINEVGTMGKIHHVNVVRLLGFCAHGFYRALVYDFFPNGSLQNFISPPDNKEIFLGWEKLQKIAIGLAKGIEYLHQGCDHRILHFDINPNNVLLDNNFISKISDFGLAKLCPKNRSTVSMTAVKGTLGYIAPEVFCRNFGNVSYKSDIYSYGMLLLEMVGGRKNVNNSKESFQILYPEWIHKLFEGGGVHIHIEDEEDIRIAKKLAIVGLWCIQWHPMNHPSMKTVIQMLEGEGENLKAPPAPFDNTTSGYTSDMVAAKYLSLELDVIHESE